MAEFDQQEAIAIDPGLTALVVIARFHHISADANQLRHNSGIKSTAFGEHDLLLAARSLGLKTRKVTVSLGRFPQTPFPALALDKDNRHFIVAGCTGEKAFVIEAGQRSPTTTTYDVHQAEAQADRQRYVLDEVRQQVGLQVWTTFQALRAASENVTNSATLLDVAQRSYVAAERRYRIGVGSILELLNAQSALAEAKRQRIQALTDWR